MALVTALMAMLMMLALGAGVTLTALTETAIAANHRDGIQALYAAEAGIDLAVSRLRATEDWRPVAEARDAAPLVEGRLADLLGGAIDARFAIVVTASPDPEGDDDILVLHSNALVSGGIRRTVQVNVRRRPATGEIEIVSWR